MFISHYLLYLQVFLEMEHGGFTWEVVTRLKNITYLHNKLLLFR